jgi:hypothetical protein
MGYMSFNYQAGLVITDEDVGGNHGYVNENLFFGGNFGGTELYGIYFKKGDTGGFDNNIFVKPSLENYGVGSRGIYMDTGTYNHFIQCRSESVEKIAGFAGDAQNNQIEIGLGDPSYDCTVSGLENYVYNTIDPEYLLNRLQPDLKLFFYDDFVGQAINGVWKETFTGTGTGTLQVGVAGKYRQSSGINNGSTCLLNFNGKMCTRVNQSFCFKIGLGFIELTNMTYKAYLRSDDNNYIGFYYNENAGGTAKWLAKCKSAGVETSVDSTITATTSEVHLEVWAKASGASVEFRINGQLVATITTNIPSATLEPYLYLTNTAGADKRVDLDYASLEHRRSGG